MNFQIYKQYTRGSESDSFLCCKAVWLDRLLGTREMDRTDCNSLRFDTPERLCLLGSQ